MSFERDIGIIGGCGRAGLPLGLAFAHRGMSVTLYDINHEAVATVSAAKMPFMEEGAAPILEESIRNGQVIATSDASAVGDCETLIVVIGTPVDEHLNPDPEVVVRTVEELAPSLRDGQFLVLRSTVYPGVTGLVEKLVASLGLNIDVAFCPERIAEGKALRELFDLPQIVSARNEKAVQRAEKLFGILTANTVRLTPEEAELAKLFTNTWRYIKFAISNQLYMMANDFGLDFEKIRSALSFDYPRAADMPGAGFAAGPCLFKDTMQLAAFNNNNFHLGQASMMINEGLPLYVVARLENKYELSKMRVGILGTAFKAESDDRRSSLSYKLKRILRVKAMEVLCHDPYVEDDDDLVSLEEMLSRADLLVVGTPHQIYADLETDKPVADIWNIRGKGVMV